MKKVILALMAAMPLAGSAVQAEWMRDVKISPDGSTIAFCYRGDIYTIPATGGTPTRLTATDYEYEQTPVWSPDSKTIAFSSDRNGSFDVYVVPASGGTPTRLTYNSANEVPEAFTPDGKNVLFSAAIQAPVSSAVFPTGRMTQVYSVPVSGGAAVQMQGTPARFISFLPDGQSFLYQDIKGHEDEWRKHHTSSVTRDVWLRDAQGHHKNLTLRGGEDTNPVAVDSDTFLYLSERDGKTVNVFQSSISDPSQPVALTDFKVHPVRFLSRGANGRMAFTYDGNIYTMMPGQQPQKLTVEINTPVAPETDKLSVRGSRDASVSPDGKSIAFVFRGNVFVTSADYPTTKQITTTPESEYQVTWGDDNRTLYYTSERDGRYNIYKATIVRDDEKDFPHATSIREERLFANDGHERTMPQLSPDGKKLAFVYDRTQLAVQDLASGNVKVLTDGHTNASRDRGFDFSWSPDSKWITMEAVTNQHDPYSDIIILNPENGEMTNITNSGYMDVSPRWVMDGNAIMFATERYGMRAHASWGSQNDVMLVFMNQDALDKWNLSKEDFELAKEAEKADKKAEKADAKADKSKKSKKAEAKDDDSDKAKPINIEFEGLQDRIVRVTPMSTMLADAALTSDGETLYYITMSANGPTLWQYSPREDEHQSLGRAPRGSFEPNADGSAIFLLGESIKKLDPKSGKLSSVDISADMPIDYAAEREFMFDYMSREEAERFYNTNLHGVDWPMMVKTYRRFLPHISNNYDLAELFSEILGELNVSHTGGRYTPPSSYTDENTASLGLLYDVNYAGPGLKVAEVIAQGPFATAKSKVAPGMIVKKINGTEITPEADASVLLTDLRGKRTLVEFYNPADGSTFEEVVKPISSGAQTALLYDRWVKQRAAQVDSLSGGRLGYVHITGMDDGSFRNMYSDLLGKFYQKEGVVVDIRWNGGGRLHEDVEVLLSGDKYFTQVIRGTEVCDMPSRRWNKPSVMLMSEACYSNAHGTPWVYKHKNIGKLVGMPVPGTMTSVNWERNVDPSMVFGIPVVGYQRPDGSYLENTQLEPDVKVTNSPETVVQGIDTQLETAVRTLLQEIDNKK